MWGRDERFLIVVAHPDDEVLGCGGTIARATEAGTAVRVVFLSEGVTARYEPADFETPKVEAEIAQRQENALHALARLGVPSSEVFFGHHRDCRLDQVSLIDMVKPIELHIIDLKATRLFMHSAHDVSVDHRRGNEAMLAAARPVYDATIRGVYAFEVLSASEWNTETQFAPNVFVDISETIERKIDAMRDYDKEMRAAPHPRSEEVIRAQARFRGTQAGLHFAEGFSLFRGIYP